MNFQPLGPKRPIKKPRPMQYACTDGNFVFLDSSDLFQSGTEIYVCTDEVIPEFQLLESGNYTLETGEEFIVINGIIQ